MLFAIKNDKAKKVNQKEFKDELKLHDLIDKNLMELFEVSFIKKEHRTEKHGRIETLGLEFTSNNRHRPVVIEYKKTMEKGQLAQANKYVDWIEKNSAEFELLVRDKLNIKADIDFSNPRIICLAQEYNMDDKCLAPKLGAELWKYTYYENDTLVIIREGEEPEQLKSKRYVSSKTIGSEKAKKGFRAPKTIEEQFDGASKELISLYKQLHDKIIEISLEIEQYTSSIEILYKTSVNFIALSVQKKSNRLRFLLRTKDNQINDENHLTEAVPKNYGWGNMNRILFVDPKDIGKKYKLDDIIDLIKQSYNMTK